MLKRQRPVSPLFSSSDSPSYCDPFDDLIPNSKRRRVLPPSLDGPSRGWGPSQPQWPSDMMDDGEEDYEDGEDNTSSAQQGSSVPPNLSLPHEYKSTNNMLYELHTLHQHRMLFTPSSSLSQITSRITHPTPYGGINHSQPGQTPMPKSGILPSENSLASVGGQHVDTVPHQFSIPTSEVHLALGQKEVQSVNERYKHTNKLLGSLVRSRRRQLCEDSTS